MTSLYLNEISTFRLIILFTAAYIECVPVLLLINKLFYERYKTTVVSVFYIYVIDYHMSALNNDIKIQKQKQKLCNSLTYA